MRTIILKLMILLLINLLFTSCKENNELIEEESTLKEELESSFEFQRSISPAREWWIDVRMKNRKLTFKEAFESILKDDGFNDGDIIKLSQKIYNIQGNLKINRRVNIIGENRDESRLYQSHSSRSTPESSLFIVCEAQGIVFKNLTINAGYKSSKAVHVNNESIEFHNVKFLDAKWAIFSNKNIGGLKVLHCLFTRAITFRGIEMNRVWSKAKVESMRQIEIKHTTFEGKKPLTGKEKFAISIDCGNEPANNNSIVTNLNNMLIEDCIFKDDFGGGIALAQVANVIIKNNTFKAGSEQKQNAIHIEDTTSNVKILDNFFLCNSQSGRKPLIFMGSSERNIIADGCKDIGIRGNIFAGTEGVTSNGQSNRIIEAERAQRINISHNKMCNMRTYKLPKISFFNKNDQIFIPTSGNNKNDCISYQILNLKGGKIKFPRP